MVRLRVDDDEDNDHRGRLVEMTRTNRDGGDN